MEDCTLVLICPFTTGDYRQRHVDTITCWLDFFVYEKGIPVLAMLPLECEPDLALHHFDKEPKTFFPVLGFDTCDRWRVGLFEALHLHRPRKHVVLWSADFECSEKAKIAADTLINHPADVDLVVGTIEASGIKEEIDRLATNPFIENWFPVEFDMISKSGFSKPRSELLRFSVTFLESALGKRWFPAEQTIHLIFQCLWNKNFKAEPVFLPNIEDDGEARNQPNVIQQVERMEVWMKYMWRDRQGQLNNNWAKSGEYQRKAERSFQIAMQAYNVLLGYWNDDYRKGKETESCHIKRMPVHS